ncbi:MAG: hypothetical protein KF760_17405 [Candidatus Eremiobacteraeota bacterium]|nr:hypothetical protein [Candidatus Eremiobacteraeota bacterium]MCW5866677.1 hypothetical protein [Candidatus Eremiobacteraeota bacterium]
MSARRKGIALVTVLLVAAVLAMLATAMVSLNRNGFLTLGQYQDRSRTVQACYAGLDYARGKILQDGAWGLTPFDDAKVPGLNVVQAMVVESGAAPDLNVVDGELPKDGSRFQLRIVNNLANRYALPAPEWSRCGVAIPPRTAFVAVDGMCEGNRRHMEVLLARKVGVGVGIYAGKDLAIRLASAGPNKVLSFSSTRPRGNHVNVNNKVLLPATANVDFGTTAARGRLQSGQDTLIDTDFAFDSNGDAGTPSSGRSLMGDAALAKQASQDLKATVYTGAPPSPPKFQPDQLKQASAPQPLAPGTYRFINHETVSFTPEGSGSPQLYVGSVPVGSARVRLGEYRFMPEGNIQVNGNLTLVGEQTKMEVSGDQMVATETSAMPVSLAVGYGAKGLPLSFDAAGTDTATKERFTVSGNLTIKGDMVGSGQLFVQKNAQGGGRLKVEGNSLLSATRTDGMAVVAEDSVHFEDVNSMAALQPFAMMTNEFDLYSQAMQPDAFTAKQNTILNDWQGQTTANIIEVVGNDDSPANTLRGRPVGNYDPILQEMAPGFVTQAGTSLIGTLVSVPQGPPGNVVDTTMTAKDLIEAYVQEVSFNQGGMTLGRHTRVREFIKSVDRGAPNPALLSVWHPGAQVAGLTSVGLSDTTYNSYSDSILTMVANQVSAYNQDARLEGKRLMQYMSGANPYSNGQRFDFIFGGILYAQKNIYAHLASKFNLLGSMLSAEGTVGFDDLTGGRVVYDPNSFEEQFDLSKAGLAAQFFWMAP